MGTQNRLINANIGLLRLAQEPGNISLAYRKAGIARSSFYEIKKAYEQFGRAGLETKPRRRPRMPDEFADNIIARVLAKTSDERGIAVKAVLTDCGREYADRYDTHLYELYTGARNIAHRTTRPASPYTNDFAERFRQTLKNEFFAKNFREKFYTSVEELQKDLDEFLSADNTSRAHSGYRYQDRPPMQTFEDLLKNSAAHNPSAAQPKEAA